MATLNLGKVAFTYDDFTPEQLALLKGEKGDKGNKGDAGLRGSRWNTGTAITGTNTTPTIFATGIDDSLINDYYFNSSTGDVYCCTESGNENTAKWKFVSNIGNTSFEVELGYMWGETDTGISEVRSIAYDGYGTLVAVGNNPDDVENGNIAYSPDGGASWLDVRVPVKTALNYVTTSNGTFYAVGENCTILWSHNGASWYLITEGHMDGKPIEYKDYPDVLQCIIWNDTLKKFMIVGGEGRGQDNYYEPLLLTSNDGRTWERHTNLNSGAEINKNTALNTITSNEDGSVLVAGGDGVIITSINGGNEWVLYTESNKYFNIPSIKFDKNDGLFKGITRDGTTFYSNSQLPNDTGWTYNRGSSDVLNDIEKIDKLNVWMAVGMGLSNTGIIYSQDGMNGWGNTWDGLSDNGKAFRYTKDILVVKHIPDVGTFLGRDDGKIMKLKMEFGTVNVTDAVKEMYEKLVMKKS